MSSAEVRRCTLHGLSATGVHEPCPGPSEGGRLPWALAPVFPVPSGLHSVPLFPSQPGSSLGPKTPRWYCG